MGRESDAPSPPLVDEGRLKPLAHGLFVYPRQSRFGAVPPTDEEVMRAFLEGAPFVLTGPDQWNALGLGTSATFAAQLVYNTKRSGEFTLGRRRFLLRRVAFPKHPSPEWFVVDLLQHAEQAAADRDELTAALIDAVRRGRFNPAQHPLVTLIEKLDNLHQRVPRPDRDPAAFVRHFEDAARMIAAVDTLPALEGYRDVSALADGMLAERQIRQRPASGDPAFAPGTDERWRDIRAAHAATGPMFWGERIGLEAACTTIRTWIAAELE